MLDRLTGLPQGRPPGEPVSNSANLMQSLQDKVEEARKKSRQETVPKGAKHKINRFEVVQFLNSTEKQFNRMLVLLDQETYDEESLLAYMEELKKQMEEMKLVRALQLKNRVKINEEEKNRLLGLIDALLKSKQFENLPPLFLKTLQVFKKELLAFIS